MISRIEIQKEFGMEEIINRMRRVALRGFPDVKAYETAAIRLEQFSPSQLLEEVCTPQPSVYQPELDKVATVAGLFSGKGLSIFNLHGKACCIDYVAYDEKGEATEWTLIPPVVEIVPILCIPGMGLDFSRFIGPDLRRAMNDKEYRLNPQLSTLNFEEFKKFEGQVTGVREICDGSHRIELARQRGLTQTVLTASDSAASLGFPYYAAPQPYPRVHIEPERVEEKLDKVHVLTSPGHKLLYRVFPTGGINSGNLRPRRERVD